MLIWLERRLNSPWQSRGLMIVCGMLYPLAFAPVNVVPLAYISLIILIFSLTKQSVLSPFKLAYYWGVGAFLVGASWVYVSIHEFGYVPVVGAALLTLLFVAYLALFKGLFGFLFHWLLNQSKPSMLFFIAPLCWVMTEYLQSIVFKGFPWLLLGYSQIDTPLSSLATWFGVYGISWFVMAFCTAIVLLIIHKNKKPYSFSLSLLISVFVLCHFYEKNLTSIEFHNTTINVGVVQPNIAQENKWDPQYFSSIMDTLLNESEKLWGADLVVWPEGAIPAYTHQVTDILQSLSKKAQQNQSQLIFGIPQYEPDTQRSYVSLLSLGQTEQVYRKQILVPFGEYVPLENWLRGVIKFLDLPMSGFTPGVSQQSPMKFEKVTVIPAICYEIVYPEIIRELSAKSFEKRPQLIVTVSNDAWFGDSFGPYQHMQMARMRSLELGLPLVRSTNDGITAMVDAHGEVIKMLPRYQQNHLRLEISLANRHTIYRHYGVLGLLGILFLSSGLIIWSIYFQRSSQSA